ncbi:hypothetical protein HH310_39105 [Actinoplanes sp. TBRC 11911]|uniref:type VII secretion target n=1 Tax=Actinoplanes sp. TBRC 11911 TaxID=2729386 RepID=UPI00145E8DA1|nr:type VII secretion target [Actinoplanes sp. TBRC 11911]NMO57170.1 hypothetical protein [Actinoplanes sp. TBRC 11911]
MNHLADRLDRAAESLTAIQARLPRLTVPAAAFGADDAGAPGHLGRDLHAHWTAVLTARSREAATAAARLTEIAFSVRDAQQRYTTTDEAAARRLRGQNW